MAESPSEADAARAVPAEARPGAKQAGTIGDILELAARAVSAHRSGLWIMAPADLTAGDDRDAPGSGSGDASVPEASTAPSSRLLDRVHLYSAATGFHTSGGILREERFPTYFDALDADDLLVVDDVTSDPRTAELAEPYARPLDIRAWIDRRIELPDGRTALVRFERCGPPSRWKSGEIHLARAVAEAIRDTLSPGDESADGAAAGDTSAGEDGPPPRAGPTAAEAERDRSYRRLLEHGRVGTLRLGPEGTVLDCNAGFVSLLEAEGREGVTGRSIREFLADEGEGERLVSRLRDLDTLPPEELRLRTEQGRSVWALMTAVRTERDGQHLALLLDFTIQKEREQELERQAHFDALTGLPNRRLLWQQATRLLALAERHDRSAAVAYLDLSGFKEINDRYGHVAGDRVLEAVGERLQGVLRDSDVGARIGGDEFAVLLSEVDGAEGVSEAGRRILEALRQPVDVGDDERVEIRARVGIALYPDHGEALDELLDRADQAMYVAYASDREIPVEVYQPDDVPPSPRPDPPTRDLQRAVDSDEFILHYQPVVGLPRGEFSGVEALIRWRHPQHGLLEPAAFLSDALQAGLLVEIDRWVLRRAIRQAAHWQRQGGPEWVSVNLALPSLRDPGLAHFLDSELEATGLEPRRLMLEVAEPDLRKTGETAVETLSAVRELGVRLAVDCRETGPEVRSSLAGLTVDLVKVDLTALRREAGGDELEATEGRLSELMADPEVPLLAEGVETESDFAWARGSVFAMAQGYYMSRPAPAREIRFPGGELPDGEDGTGDGPSDSDPPGSGPDSGSRPEAAAPAAASSPDGG